jgi:hypothetical protein
LVLLDDHRNVETGRCNPKIETLARELAVSTRSIDRSLDELRDAGFIQSKWGQRSSQYRVASKSRWQKILLRQIGGTEKHPVTPNWRNALRQVGRTEGSASLYELDPMNYKQASQPASSNSEAGRLAEIAAILTNAWPNLVGAPGKKLLSKIAGILGDTSLAEFRGLLESKRRKVESFGLAELLAADLISRRNGAAAANQTREDADRQRQIHQAEDMLAADPGMSQRDRQELLSYIAKLKKSAKSETKPRGEKPAGGTL